MQLSPVITMQGNIAMQGHMIVGIPAVAGPLAFLTSPRAISHYQYVIYSRAAVLGILIKHSHFFRLIAWAPFANGAQHAQPPP